GLILFGGLIGLTGLGSLGSLGRLGHLRGLGMLGGLGRRRRLGGLLRLHPFQRRLDGVLLTALRGFLSGLFRALAPARFLPRLFALGALLMELEAFARVLAALVSVLFLADVGLGGAVILNERYMTGTGP